MTDKLELGKMSIVENGRAPLAIKSKHSVEYQIEAFWALVDMQDEGCWNWLGVTIGDGYGSVYFDRAMRVASRVSFALHASAPIPNGMIVCHDCDNPSCVRPSHLFLGTQADNIHDMDKKKRRVVALESALKASAAARRAITHCPRGHEYSESNTYRSKAGRRHCRSCMNQRHRNGRKMNREARALLNLAPGEPSLLDPS